MERNKSFGFKRSCVISKLNLISSNFAKILRGGLFTKKFELYFKGSAASAPPTRRAIFTARLSTSLIFCARDFLALRASKEIIFSFPCPTRRKQIHSPNCSKDEWSISTILADFMQKLDLPL